MSTPGRLSTCGTCGGTIQYWMGLRSGWRHVTEPARPHQPSPDDGAVSGPGRDDLPPATATDCRLIGAGDGSVMVYCQPCKLCLCPNVATLNAALGFWEEHCEDSHSTPREPEHVPVPDPWTDPDAAAAHQPPPF
jgi:hypothetical protein